MLTVGTVLPALFTLGAVLLLSSPTVKKKQWENSGTRTAGPCKRWNTAQKLSLKTQPEIH